MWFCGSRNQPGPSRKGCPALRLPPRVEESEWRQKFPLSPAALRKWDLLWLPGKGEGAAIPLGCLSPLVVPSQVCLGCPAPGSVAASSLPSFLLVPRPHPSTAPSPLVPSSGSPAPAPSTPLPLLMPYPRSTPPGPALSPSVPWRGRPAPPSLDVAEAAPAMLAQRGFARRPGAGRRRP